MRCDLSYIKKLHFAPYKSSFAFLFPLGSYLSVLICWMPHVSLSLAAMFLEHWKRRQISLNYSWDLTGMEEEEVRSHTYIVTLCYSLLTSVCLDSCALAKSWFQWQCFLTLTNWKWLTLTVMWCDTMVASLSDNINVYPPMLYVNVPMWSQPKMDSPIY